MAGVNYEVNIQLNAKTLDKQLGDLEKRVNNLKKNLAAPLRGQDQASRQSVARAEKAAKLEDRIRATRVITFNLGRRLNRLEERGIKVNEQRVQLNRAATSTNKKLVEQARTQNKLVREFVQAEERKLKLGVKAGRMQAEDIDALYKAKVRRYGLDQQIRRLEEEGLKTDKLRAKLGEITSAQIKRDFGTHKQLSAQLSLEIRKERDKLNFQRRQTRELEKQLKLSAANAPFSPIQGSPFMAGSPMARRGDPRAYTTPVGPFPAFRGTAPSSPIGGAPNIAGSPAGLRRQRRIEQASGVALGAGFPLLFGGGPGSILGGAVGGLVPGPAGFAAQIGLSAIGQQFDRIGAAAINLGKALDPLTFDLKTVAGATGIAGTKTEEFLAKIEEFGGKAAAAAEASKLMASRVGKDATDALTKFGKDAQIVGNQISIIFTKVLAAIAAAAGPLLSSLGAGLTRINRLGGFRERTGLTGADLTAQKFLRRTGRLSRKQLSTFATGLGLDPSATAGQVRKAAEARAVSSQQAFDTEQTAALEVKAGQLEAAAEAAKAKKGRRSRVPDLQAEEQKLKSLLGLERTMFELKRNDDALGVRQLEHRMRLAELAEKEAKIRASDVPQKEKDLAISNLGLEAKRAELQLAYDIEQINKEAAQRAFEEMQNKIKQQNQLNKGMQQQLQLAQQVSDVLGQGMTRSFDLLITGANNWGMALRDIAANVLQDIARQLIQIYVIEQAVGFMRTLFSGTSLTAPGGRYEGQAGALAAKPPPLPPLPGKALGGAVSSGKPYMVGERGPELFVPGASGNIVPNNAMGGSNIVVNVDASGSSVEGNAEDSKRLGEAIGVAVRQELIKQKRPGGLLA